MIDEKFIVNGVAHTLRLPESLRYGFCSLSDGSMIGYAALETFIAAWRGFTISCWYERKAAKGTMGERQKEIGRALASQVKECLEKELLRTGWEVVGATTEGKEIWKLRQ